MRTFREMMSFHTSGQPSLNPIFVRVVRRRRGGGAESRHLWSSSYGLVSLIDSSMFCLFVRKLSDSFSPQRNCSVYVILFQRNT